jgi:hypothetical protein
MFMITLIYASLNVLGQTNKKINDTRRCWSTWKIDTTITLENGNIIIKKRERLKYWIGHNQEEMIYRYDGCDNLVQKTKINFKVSYNRLRFKTKYDRHYKNKCTTNIENKLLRIERYEYINSL